MIIKSLSRRSGSTGQLINYILRYILEKEQKEEQEKEAKALSFSKQNISVYLLAFKEGNLKFSALPYTEISAYRDLIERELNNAVRIAKTTEIGKELARREKVSGSEFKKTQLFLTPNYLVARNGGGDRFFKLSSPTLVTDIKQDAKKQKESFIIRHNLRSRSINSIKEYVREFGKLESLRTNKRMNSVSVYHHIISFSSKDREFITDDMLVDIASKFISLRSPNSVVLGTKHTDRENTIHMHLAMSAVDLAGRSVRVSKAKFQEIKTELQQYQQERYPQLSHSLPDHGKKSRVKAKEAEVEKIKSGRRPTEKSTLLKVLESTFSQATSKDHFLFLLQEQGYSPYYRGGTITGVSVGTQFKFRFSRLGYSQEKINSLDLAKEYEEKHLAELRLLRENKTMGKMQERLATLNEARPGAPTESIQVEELQSIRDSKDNSRDKEEERNSQSGQTGRDTDSREHEDTERNDSRNDDGRSR